MCVIVANNEQVNGFEGKKDNIIAFGSARNSRFSAKC